MTNPLFQALIEAVMELDPWPYGSREGLIDWINDESRKRGYTDWIDALHRLNQDRIEADRLAEELEESGFFLPTQLIGEDNERYEKRLKCEHCKGMAIMTKRWLCPICQEGNVELLQSLKKHGKNIEHKEYSEKGYIVKGFIDLKEEIIEIYLNGHLPDGDGVNIPTALWAESWAERWGVEITDQDQKKT